MSTYKTEDKAYYKDKVEQIWLEYDKDRSGKLEKKEVMAFLQKTLWELTGEQPSNIELERNFKIMDLDRIGDIDKEECYKFLKGFHIGHVLRQLSDDKIQVVGSSQ